MARTCILPAFRLQMPWRFFSGVTFVLFCFVFRPYAFVESAALRSIVLRYAGVPIATRTYVFLSFYFFLFLFIWRLRFVRVFLYHFHFLFLCMESTSCVLSFRMVLDFLHQLIYVRIQSINQNIPGRLGGSVGNLETY